MTVDKGGFADRFAEAIADFDITHPLWSEDFHGLQAHMRSECPVLHSNHQGGYFALTKHSDIVEVLRDHETYSNAGGVFLTPLPGNQKLIPTDADPPIQREYRRLIDRYLSAARVAAYEPDVRRTADALIDEFAAAGRCDIYHDFAVPLPSQVFLRLVLDVHGEDEAEANRQVERAMSSETLEEVEAGFNGLKNWCAELIESRRGEPERDDLIAGLIGGKVFQRPLTPEEQVSTLMSVTIGGLETASSVIAYGVAMLIENPEVQQRVRADPPALNVAVEEIVRLASPTALMRTVTADTELSGQQLKEGDRVLIVFPAGNRDPAVFEEPDEFSMERPNAKEAVSFGAGMHRCPGSNLARMALRAAFSTILERLEDLALAEPVSFTATQIRSPRAVNITFREAARTEAGATS